MRIILAPLKIFFCFILCISCTDNLTFDQISLDIEPIVNVPIAYFELDQNDFFDDDDDIEITSITDTAVFRVLESTTVQENLIKAVIDFEIINRFDRSFVVKIDFLDSNGVITHSVSDLNIAVGDLNYSATRTIIVENSPEFLNSRKVRVKINLFPSPNVLDPTISKTLVFRSAGTFYLSF